MALEAVIIKTPYEVGFTGNTMPFVFAITPYGANEAEQDISLIVRVEVSVEYNDFIEARSQSFYPDSTGKISIDVSTIVAPYSEYYIPRPTLAIPVYCPKQSIRYRVTYVLVKNTLVIGSVTTSDIFFALKGGMSQEMFHPTAFFTDAVGTNKKPLQFSATGEKVFMSEARYMYWLYNSDDLEVQTVSFVATLNDNTTITTTNATTIVCGKWEICCVPVGFTQSGLLALVTAGKFAKSYTVSVKKGATLIVSQTFNIDHRVFYNTSQILYRNSVGGLETITLRGQIDFEADYERQLATRTIPPEAFANMNLLPQTVPTYTDESPKFKGDTGFLKKEAINKLRDLFLSFQFFELVNDKFLPNFIIGKSVKFYANRDNLLSLQIEWQRAYVNKQYTPNALFTVSATCPAVEHVSVKQVDKNTLQIVYGLPIPYDVVEIQIYNGTTTVNFTYQGNSGSILQPFDNPATSSPVNITVKARVLCDQDADPVDAGAWTTLTVSVTGNSAPVANDDNYNIPTGHVGSIILVGSVLINDYDPDGDAIAVVAVTGGATHAGGTYDIDAAGIVTYTPPTSGYVGNDYFTYTIQETGSGGLTSTAKCYINVGNAISSVYAKLVTVVTNQNRTAINARVYIKYFSNPQGTNPLNISALGLTINYKRNTTSLTVTGTGVENLVFTGEILSMDDHHQITSRIVHEVLAGTGYIVI